MQSQTRKTSMFDVLRKTSRHPLYLPPEEWNESHLKHFRLSEKALPLALPHPGADAPERVRVLPRLTSHHQYHFALPSFLYSSITDFLVTRKLLYDFRRLEYGKRVMFKLVINQVKTTVAPESVAAVITGKPGILVGTTHWDTKEKLWKPPRRRRNLKVITTREYPITPYAFANLLAIAQSRYHYNKTLDSYKVELIHTNADMSVPLISAEFPRRYIEHVTTGYGDIPDDMKVKLRIKDNLQPGKQWGSRLYRFLLLAKQHLDAVWEGKENPNEPENSSTKDTSQLDPESSSDESDSDRNTKRQFWTDAAIFEHIRGCAENQEFIGKPFYTSKLTIADGVENLFEEMYSSKRVNHHCRLLPVMG
ncbi:hypothetical protein TWF281_002214 [Arthrobotrys megalospora]